MYHNFIICLTWILHFNMCKQRAMNALVIKKFTIENFAGALFLYAFYHVWVIYFFVPQNMSTRTRQIGRQSSENQILFQLKVILPLPLKLGSTMVVDKTWSLIVLYHLMVSMYRNKTPANGIKQKHLIKKMTFYAKNEPNTFLFHWVSLLD